MTRESFYESQDGILRTDGYQLDLDDDLPDGAIPLNELPTIEDELRDCASYAKSPLPSWRFD